MSEKPVKSNKDAAVIELRNVHMSFCKPTGKRLAVLGGIDVTLCKDEVLGLLGPSGSGKSTLLRIATGLIKPTSGRVVYCGKPLKGPAPGIAVVFQRFALFPWLTVLENVEASLNALGVSGEEAHRKAMSAIDLIGLSGFESAYPRELSGGMRQRVGFARALVIDPTVLLMDEPFSELDILTAETLRTDFIDLWTGGELAIESVLLVTHNIEEAALLCDRVLVLCHGPARVIAEVPIRVDHPRNRLDPAFREAVDELHSILTPRFAETSRARSKPRDGRTQTLPGVSVYAIARLIAALALPRFEGDAKLTSLARAFSLDVEALVPVAEASHTLEFAELKGVTIKLTAPGHVFAQGTPEQRRRLFKEHLLRFVPLAAHICQAIEESEGHGVSRKQVETTFEHELGRREAQSTLRTVIRWGRYAELFEYDPKTGTFGKPSREAKTSA